MFAEVQRADFHRHSGSASFNPYVVVWLDKAAPDREPVGAWRQGFRRDTAFTQSVKDADLHPVFRDDHEPRLAVLLEDAVVDRRAGAERVAVWVEAWEDGGHLLGTGMLDLEYIVTSANPNEPVAQTVRIADGAGTDAGTVTLGVRYVAAEPRSTDEVAKLPEFNVGDRVEGRYQGGGTWVRGRIEFSFDDATYGVAWEDTSLQSGRLHASELRPFYDMDPGPGIEVKADDGATPDAPRYEVGDHVFAKHLDGKWHHGRVASVLDGGVKYKVRFQEAGLRPMRLRPKHMRPRSQPDARNPRVGAPTVSEGTQTAGGVEQVGSPDGTASPGRSPGARRSRRRRRPRSKQNGSAILAGSADARFVNGTGVDGRSVPTVRRVCAAAAAAAVAFLAWLRL